MVADLPIKDIMTKEVVSVFPDDSFEKIRNLFNTHSFHHLPVITKNGTVIGIISKDNWLVSLKKVSVESSGKTWNHKYLDSLTAEEVMTRDPMVLDPDDTIGLAADIFLANKFHALPIVEDNQLLGLLTSHDLLKFAYQ